MSQTPDSLRPYYEEAFRALDPNRTPPDVDVSFYPYIGINHTIRIRDGGAFVRVAEICRDMPVEGHRGLAYILVAKLLRKRVPKRARDVYSAIISGEEYRERATENKRTRGRKVLSGSLGNIYDLDELFESVNSKYFGGRIPKPEMTWSARKTFRILGHHDATHDTIVVSRSLDSADVPRYVVEYIVFHEMLHIHHPTQHVNGRRYNHTAAFRHDERKFRYYNESERWIEQNVRRLKRNAKRK